MTEYYLDADWLVLPLVPGGKAAKGKWGDVTMPLSELLERGEEFRPFDLGIRLDENDLLLIDADTRVIRHPDTRPGEPPGAYWEEVIDGPANLIEWEAAHPGVLPETWEDCSPGRADGSHRQGLHKLYQQCPGEEVRGMFLIAPEVQVKTSGFVRVKLTGMPKSEPLTYMVPLLLPQGSAAILRAGKIKGKAALAERAKANGGGASGAAGISYDDFDKINLSDLVAGTQRTYYLTRVKGRCEADGMSEDDANQEVVRVNDLLGEPVEAGELAARVLAHKEWGHWAADAEVEELPAWNGGKPPAPPADDKNEGGDDEERDKPRTLLVLPSPGKPGDVARELVAREFTKNKRPLIVHWRDTWLVWDGCWLPVSEAWIESKLWFWTQDAVYEQKLKKSVRYAPWQPTVTSIGNLKAALRSFAYLDEHTEYDSWLQVTISTLGNRYLSNLRREGGKTAIRGYVREVTVTEGSNRYQILNVTDRSLRDSVPEFFSTYATDFPYDPKAECPEWQRFVHTTWTDDPDSVKLLQEWAGYLISGATCAQKMMALIGPKRSGKSTIGRVLAQLVGKEYTVSPTLSSLCERFGLQNFPGKRLAIIADARLRATAKDVSLAVTRLLMISGEDPLDVDRKNKSFWTGPLPVRIMLLSNETPRLSDASGTIATRFLTLQLTRSWYGQEDMDLPGRLMNELPGIFNWALDGLDRLRANDYRFTCSEGSAEVEAEMEALSSPVKIFMRDCCDRGPERWVFADKLYGYWKAWCQANGMPPGPSNVFSRDIRSAADGQLGTRTGNNPSTGKRGKIVTGIDLSPHADIPEEFLWSLNGSGKMSLWPGYRAK